MQRGQDAGVAVQQRERRRAAADLRQRLVGGDQDPPVAGAAELAPQPRHLRRRHDARRPEAAVDRVQGQDADARAGVEGLVQRPRGRRAAVERVQGLGGPVGILLDAVGVGRDPPRAARQAVAQDAVDGAVAQQVLAAPDVEQPLLGLDEEAVAGRDAADRRRGRDLAGDEQVVVAGQTRKGMVSPGERTGRWAAASSPGRRGGSTSGR